MHSLHWISQSYNAAAIANLPGLSLHLVSGRKIEFKKNKNKTIKMDRKTLKRIKSFCLKTGLKYVGIEWIRVETRTDRCSTFFSPSSSLSRALICRDKHGDKTGDFQVSGPGLDTCRLLCVLSFDLIYGDTQPYQRYFNSTAWQRNHTEYSL